MVVGGEGMEGAYPRGGAEESFLDSEWREPSWEEERWMLGEEGGGKVSMMTGLRGDNKPTSLCGINYCRRRQGRAGDEGNQSWAGSAQECIAIKDECRTGGSERRRRIEVRLQAMRHRNERKRRKGPGGKLPRED